MSEFSYFPKVPFMLFHRCGFSDALINYQCKCYNKYCPNAFRFAEKNSTELKKLGYLISQKNTATVVL